MNEIARTYYASRISDNKAKTPEGYLICLNVPIARTGWQEYMPSELGVEGSLPVQLYRSEEEVFSPAAIASFEGKPVTSEHPRQWLAPDNVSAYMRGVATNVRRGSDTESDLLLADLIIYDPILTAEIDAGKRDVSSGYDYICVPLEGEGGKYVQKNIRGNHIAIVREGRAGKRVAVRDEKPKPEGRKRMKTNKDTIWGKMFKAFAADAEPEELAEASKLMNQEGKDEGTPPAAAPAPAATPAKDEGNNPPGDAGNAVILDLLKTMQGDIAELKAGKTAEPATDALAELEKEVAGGKPAPVADEGSVTIDPQQLNDNAPVSSPEDRPENPIPGADSRAAVLMAIKAVKPVVAAIKDPVQRKQASDMMVKTFREQLQVAPCTTPSATNPYASMTNPAKPKTAQDNKPDAGELGEYLKNKYNPHFKEKK